MLSPWCSYVGPYSKDGQKRSKDLARQGKTFSRNQPMVSFRMIILTAELSWHFLQIFRGSYGKVSFINFSIPVSYRKLAGPSYSRINT